MADKISNKNIAENSTEIKNSLWFAKSLANRQELQSSSEIDGSTQ